MFRVKLQCFRFGLARNRNNARFGPYGSRVLAFSLSIATLALCMVAMASETRSQVSHQLTKKEVVELCNRHTKQSAASVSFDLGILAKLIGKTDIHREQLIKVSDFVFYLIGQDEVDCHLLLLDKMTPEEYRSGEGKRLEALVTYQHFRENAETSAHEKVTAKPPEADPNSLLQELLKKLPLPGAGGARRGGTDLQGSVGEQLNQVIDVARKAGDRDQ